MSKRYMSDRVLTAMTIVTVAFMALAVIATVREWRPREIASTAAGVAFCLGFFVCPVFFVLFDNNMDRFDRMCRWVDLRFIPLFASFWVVTVVWIVVAGYYLTDRFSSFSSEGAYKDLFPLFLPLLFLVLAAVVLSLAQEYARKLTYGCIRPEKDG